jgi:hypothetical protein
MSFFGIPIRNGLGVGIANYATLRNKPKPNPPGLLSHTLLQIGLTTPAS